MTGHAEAGQNTASALSATLLSAALCACAPAATLPGPPVLPPSPPPAATVTIHAPTLVPTPTDDFRVTTIGVSVEGRPITAHRFGDGPVTIVAVGGLHGGYEWNTVLLAYALIDYLDAHPAALPPDASVIVIPSANPDGLYAVTRAEGRFAPGDVLGNTSIGRLNANEVDLNRNWDCNWKPEAHWGERLISAGSEPFSEPETRALSDYILSVMPRVVILWHSAANGVFAGGCGERSAYNEGKTLAGLYAEAAGYGSDGANQTGDDRFTSYPITGDAANWISAQEIPALVVELSTHTQIEFDENWRGLEAALAALEP